MRVVDSQFAALLQQESTTFCRLLTITRSDGLVLRFTDASKPIVFGGQTFQSDYSFTCSAITMSLSGNDQSITLEVIMDDLGFKESDLLARKFDDATAEIVLVDYENLDKGSMTYATAIFGQIKVTDKLRATIELLPTSAGSTTTSGKLPNRFYSKTCRAAFCDNLCALDADDFSVEFTVDTVTGLTFWADNLPQANGYWSLGSIKWLTGDNAGSTSVVRASVPGAVYTSTALSADIKPGDTGKITRGCQKTFEACQAYSNVVHFQGEPDIPTNITVEQALPYLPYG